PAAAISARFAGRTWGKYRYTGTVSNNAPASISVSIRVNRKCLGVGAGGSLRNLTGKDRPNITNGNTAGLICRTGFPPGPAAQAILALGVVCPGRTIANGSAGSSLLKIERSRSYPATFSAD